MRDEDTKIKAVNAKNQYDERPTRLKARFWALPLFIFTCTLIFFGVSLLVTAFGVWGTEAGKELLHVRTITARGRLVSVPLASRGINWQLESFACKIFLELPCFIVGFNGDRASMYGNARDIGEGKPVGFRESFMIFNYSAVEGVISNPHQPRGVYLGAAEVPSRCMGPDTLIFTS